jgi:hypothetical protein
MREYFVFLLFTLQTVLLCVVTDAWFEQKARLSATVKQYSSEIQILRDEIAELTLDLSMLLPPCVKVDEFVATAYEPSRRSCGRWAKYGLTKMGTRPGRLRTAAVDPKVIPLGVSVFRIRTRLVCGRRYRISNQGEKN